MTRSTLKDTRLEVGRLHRRIAELEAATPARLNTARTRADESSRISDMRYRSLFDSAPDGIVIADPQGRYIDANASICRMLGYTHEELVGLTASDIVDPDEFAHVGPALASVLGGAEYHRQWRFRRRDGSLVAADVMAIAMPDGNILAMIRDITSQNEVDAALRTTEERMRFALLNAHVGIWDLDYRSGVLQWSDVMEEQYGLARGTFGGTFEAFVERVHPEDRASVLEMIGEAARTGSDFSVLHRTNQTGGAVRWLCGTGRIVTAADGLALRAIGISQDVTERHTLEEQFQQAQKMEAVGHLAGGIAHDFNNLLTVILGFCDLLLEGGDPKEARQADIREIHKAGTRAAVLTRQLLAFSRKQIIEPTVLNLNDVLAALRPMIERLIKENVTIKFEMSPGLASVRVDPGQLEQVVINLAVNAQDAMPRGGTLTIATANIDLDEHYAAMRVDVTPGPYVVLTVTDSGTGMPPDVRKRLFEPFFTTKEVGKGTGLGLASVHGIVARSGGSVDVWTEVGRGASFKVYFPQTTAEVDLTPFTRAGVPRTGSERVLVVEDAEGLRELTKRLLERQGYSAVVAANAEDAVRLFQEHQCDVLLTDVVMPGPSGPELTQELLKLRPGLKVIYMSGYTDEAIVRHGVLKPGIAFLHKPFTGAALGRKIREALDR